MLGVQRGELGGSEFIKLASGNITGNAPAFEIAHEIRLQKATLHGIRNGLINSAHDCSEGGLAICLAEKAITSTHGLGADIDFPFAIDSANLFGETQSRIVVTVAPESAELLYSVCAASDIDCVEIGTVRADTFTIEGLLSTTVEKLKTTYFDALEQCLAQI